MAEQSLDQVAVDTGCDTVARAAEYCERLLGVRALGQHVDGLDFEPARLHERLDRLEATDVRAREDPADLVALQLLDQAPGLLPPALVEGPQAIIAIPLRPLPGCGVADQEDDRASTSSRELRTARSRFQESICAASSMGNQRTSSTS